jgi:hypothetical protein
MLRRHCKCLGSGKAILLCESGAGGAFISRGSGFIWLQEFGWGIEALFAAQNTKLPSRNPVAQVWRRCARAGIIILHDAAADNRGFQPGF